MDIRIILTYISIFITLSTALDYRLPDTVVPTRYELTFHINPTKFDFTGLTTIIFDTTETTKELKLHATPGKIEITKVIFDATFCDVTSSDNITEIVTITCSKNFENKNNLITIAYTGKYSEDAKGIFKSYYEEKGIVKAAVATQLEATFARRLFPCLDEPRFKTIFDVTVYHPKDCKVVGNGIQKGIYPSEDEQSTVFETTPQMSTYLIAFVVAEFEAVDTEIDNFSIFFRPDVKKFTNTAMEYSLPLIYKMGNWTDLGYFQLGNKKMTHVALSTLPIEAMENWGLITFEEIDQIDEGDKTTFDHKQKIVTITAHELAHQWFGDLVTMNWWSDTWLNEGFATYFEYHLPAMLDDFNFDLERQFVSDIVHSSLQTDAFPNSPLSNEDKYIQTPDEIQDKFDDISYNKGSCIIRMMKGILGEEKFQNAIRKYLSNNKYKNTKPKDLLDIMETVHKSETYPLNVTMIPYIYKAGYPLVTVTRTGKNVTIKQEKYSILENKDNIEWYIPISYTTSGEKNFKVDIKEWLEPKQTLDIEFKDDFDWIILNLQQTGYFRVNYDDSLWDKLIAFLKGKNKDQIDVINRAQLLDDIFNVARIGKVSYEKVFQLAEYLKAETEYYPWFAYFNGISFILDHIDDKETTKLIKTLTLDWINNAFDKENSTDNSPIGIYKNLLIKKWKCYFEDSTCLDYIKKSFDEFKNTSSFSDYNERYLVLCNSLRWSSKPEEDFNFVVEKLSETDAAYTRRDFLNSLACIKDQKVLAKYLEQFRSDYNRSFTKQESKTSIISVINSGHEGVESVLELLYHWTIYLSEQYKGFFTVNELIELLGSKITNEQQLSKFLDLKNYTGYIDEEVINIANQTAHKNLAWASNYNKDIKAVLKKISDGDSDNGHTIYCSIFMIVSMTLTSLFL